MRNPVNRTIHILSSLALMLSVIAADGVRAFASTHSIHYHVRVIGDFGAAEDETDRSDGRAINALGQVTGQAYCLGVCYHAFRYPDNGLTPLLNLGTLGGDGSWGEAINAAGQVTGGSYLSDFTIHAFRYDDDQYPNQMRDLGTLTGWCL